MNIIKVLIVLTLFPFSTSYLLAQDEGFKEVQLTHTNSDNRYASYNNSGTKILFESNRDGRWQVYTMDINGKRQKKLFRSASNNRRPTWHPYKDMILFESDKNGGNELFIYSFDTNSVKKIPISLIGEKSFARFAPNGVEIIFCHKENEEVTNLYICSLKGKRLRKIVSNKHINLYPHFSPRGDNVVYFSNRNTQGESNIIYSYNIITEDRNRLTYFKDHSEYPNWSKVRGSRVAYSAKVNDMVHSEIFIMRNNGTRKVQVTYNNVEDILPSWSPNDINLLVTGYRNGYYQICKILLKEPLSEKNKPLHHQTQF